MTARELFYQGVMPGFEAHQADWLAKARAVALELGRSGHVVTVNDVRKRCPPPPEADPRVMGAIFTRGEWRRVGYINSNRAACHGRPIAAFVKDDRK